MRNLKKFLALVLAMVMAFSLMLTASAVDYDDYQDKDSIPTEFAESVEVLTGLDILKGDGPDGAKSFRPGDTITRAEAAAIIYRVATADVNDTQVKIYADYSSFTDVNKDDWFAGYVGYCQNAGFIKGTTPTTFNPYGQVTGYEALAMILRVVGYGKNDEFVGSEWQVNVASRAKTLGVTKNVVNANFETTLNYAARRDVVADLVFQTMATVPMVEFTPALAYNDKQSITSSIYNPTLGQQNFGLYCGNTWTVIDDWGRPGYYWYKNGTWDGTTVTGAGYTAYVVSANHPIYNGTRSAANIVATIEATPSYETKEQVRECDVASALKIETEATFNLFVNGDSRVTDSYRIVATDTVTKVGGQGRVTEFYRNTSSKWFPSTVSAAVMIDTMLAKVNAKSDAVLDPAEHVITPAKLEVTIYDGPEKTNVATVAGNAVSNRTISKPSTSKANWDQFSVGDYILIHGYTVANSNAARPNQTDKEEAAFETDKVVAGTATGTLFEGTNVWIAKNDNNGKAPSIQGKQTVTYWNQGKHQVDGKDYPDQICLFLDRAGSNTNTTFTWFFDLYGNLIGIGDAKATNYGVITAIYSAFAQGSNDTTGAVKAIATVKYADGTTGTVEIDRFLMSTKATGTTAGAGATNIAGNAGTAQTDPAKALYAVRPATPAGTDGWTVELRPLYDTTSHAAMSADAANPGFITSDANLAGYIYIAPSTVTNNYAHWESVGADQPSVGQDVYGILLNHMFEFTTANDNAVVAIEVAGTGANENLYVNNYNGIVNSNNTTDHVGKIYKSLGFLTLDVDGTVNNSNGGAANVWLDNETKIMIRGGLTSATSNIVCYNGVSELPGDVTLLSGSEVDWADTDGDGRAEYLYVTGNVPGLITYSLFYYNGGAAQWDGTVGTMAGYLDGKSATVTFPSKALFDIVNNSQAYDGHLFALQLTNGVVSAVMGTDAQDVNGTAVSPAVWTQQLLNNTTTANLTETEVNAFATNIKTVSTTGTPFVVGTQGGNTYSATTEAIYYLDTRDEVASATGITKLSYQRDFQGNRIVVTENGSVTDTYWIAPTADIYGELEWLNIRQCDVTIVYENGTALSATQIYVTPDPDVTPSSWPTPVVPGQFGIDGNVSVPATQALMNSAILSGVPNTVIYSGTLKPDFNGASPAQPIQTTLGIGSVDADELLYFPFSCANGENVNLSIKAANGTVVYSETITPATGALAASSNNHVFVINFCGGANAGYSTGAMTSGTYTFAITNTTSGVTLSSGSFTLANA